MPTKRNQKRSLTVMADQLIIIPRSLIASFMASRTGPWKRCLRMGVLMWVGCLSSDDILTDYFFERWDVNNYTQNPKCCIIFMLGTWAGLKFAQVRFSYIADLTLNVALLTILFKTTNCHSYIIKKKNILKIKNMLQFVVLEYINFNKVYVFFYLLW